MPKHQYWLGWKWTGWVALFLALDQATKWWVIEHIRYSEWVPIFPGLHFTHAHNTGIAFSLFSNQASLGQMLLIGFILCISLYLAIWLIKTPYEDKWTGFSLAMILGGALGNLIDRLAYGHVIDFIDCYIGSWHWYTFNVADGFITIGAILLFKTILFSPEDDATQKGDAACR